MNECYFVTLRRTMHEPRNESYKNVQQQITSASPSDNMRETGMAGTTFYS